VNNIVNNFFGLLLVWFKIKSFKWF